MSEDIESGLKELNIKEISRIEVKEGDLFFLEYGGSLSTSQAKHLHESWNNMFLDKEAHKRPKLVILENGMKLSAVCNLNNGKCPEGDNDGH